MPLMRGCEKYCRPGQATDNNIMQCIRVAYKISKATNTHSEYIIVIAFSLQKLLHERVSLLHYKYIACCFLLSVEAAVLEEGKTCADITCDLTPNLCKSTGFLEEIYGPLRVFLQKS